MTTDLRLPARRLDFMLVILLCLADLAIFLGAAPGAPPGGYMAFVVSVGYLPLFWRRCRPLLVLILTMAHSFLIETLFSEHWPVFNVWLALGAVAFYCPRRTAECGLLAAFLSMAWFVIDTGSGGIRTALTSIIANGGLLVAIFEAGRWAAWTARRRQEDAERAAADAVRAERRCIARDLHDIVTHAVSLMLLQAGGAAHTLRVDPARAETALGHVDELGQQVVVELQRMLDLLAADTDRSATQRLPELRDLQQLVERMRTDTFKVSLDVTGTPVPLAPGVDLFAYRIVQEALINAIRYADQHFPVRITVAWRPAVLEIQVSNQVSCARSPLPRRFSNGRGLIGMRERAAAVEGRCQAGVRADGSFRVRAFFPLVRPTPQAPEPPAEVTEQSSPPITEPQP
ncbi:ATPase [Streptomyces minutiscleroticus]|uniref:histidine kinase n=1 Tax=Streptomyces minutiscleroticus TaxID=68238 RepID=A0A918P3T5_9ACTN|nr:histidine kinase [Streptomyces minutiscleroticus]GGY19432.1 ATPase [Streptomyces minutiscleroticus]